jgi:hypothetical protein
MHPGVATIVDLKGTNKTAYELLSSLIGCLVEKFTVFLTPSILV